MITPHLERLIWEGKATYKTFIAGGGQKCNLPIPNDHFVIITDITYFNTLMIPEDRLNDLKYITDKLITQVNIFSDKNFNRYLFRNNFTTAFSSDGQGNFPIGHVHHDVYLIHQNKGVSFTFSYGQPFKFNIDALAAAQTTALKPILDYGKVGDPNALFVSAEMSNPGWSFCPVEGFGTFAPTTRELSFPVDSTTNIPFINRNLQFSYPIMQVAYLLIKGIPTDFGFK